MADIWLEKGPRVVAGVFRRARRGIGRKVREEV